MEISELVSGFLASEQGRGAIAALGQNHGLDANAANAILGHAASAAGTHVNDNAGLSGLLGENTGRNFFAAFAAGLVKGDGVMGALEDGAIGALVGRVTEALVTNAGMDSSMASGIAATATPYLKSFIKQHIGG
jgi:hypothetical protein